MKRMSSLSMLSILFSVIFISCSDDKSDPVQPPQATLDCTILTPPDSVSILQGDSLTIIVKAVSSDNSLKEIVVMADNDTIGVTTAIQDTVIWKTKKDIDSCDFYYETGEPYVDWARFQYNTNDQLELVKNGYYDADQQIVLVDTLKFKSAFPGKTIEDFMWQVNVGNGIYVKVLYNINGSNYEVHYPAEAFADLPSSYGSQTQLSLRVNQSYDSAGNCFDEFEAYTRPIRPEETTQAGFYAETGNIVKWVGTYTVYYGLNAVTLMVQNQNWSQITIDAYSTWLDITGNNHFTKQDGIIETPGTVRGIHEIKVIAKDKNGNVKTVKKSAIVN